MLCNREYPIIGRPIIGVTTYSVHLSDIPNILCIVKYFLIVLDHNLTLVILLQKMVANEAKADADM